MTFCFFVKSGRKLTSSLIFFDKVEKASGSCVNRHKTMVLKLPGCVEQLPHVVDSIKILGVFFHTENRNVSIQKNYSAIKERLLCRLNKYSKFNLTLPGKVLVANSLFFPLAYHASAVYEPPVDFLAEVEASIYGWRWEHKREMVGRKIMETSSENGGLGLENLTRKSKAFYILHNLLRPVQEEFSHTQKSIFI